MRKNASKATLTQAEIRQQLIQQANQAQEKFKESEYAEEFADEIVPNVRAEVAPPLQPEKSRFNPDQIVDIVKFIEHPYFCNLKPYPLQRLILKCFYMGQEGNTDLVIQDIPQEERVGCSGCVWEFVKKNEEKSIEMSRQNRPYKASFSVINSPCLTCSRMDQDIVKERYENEKDNATNPDSLRKVEELEQRPFIDNFQTEMDLFESEEFDPKLRAQILDKCNKRFKFQELVLVLGRRSGKSFLVSTIALYELYRLICMGHPQARYGLMEFDSIYLLNVARNEEQAKNAIFAKIKQTVLASPFFEPYIGKDTELEMRFFTENDRKENERREAVGLNLFSGSLVLKCGSSSASGLVGLTCWCVIMDEIAAMAGDNPDSGLDYDLYNDLKPSLATFGRDGKMMMLSNPKGPIGLLYDLHENRLEDPSTLVMRGPTWLVNPNIDRDFLESEKLKNGTEYQMQYGAEFGASSSDPMFTEDSINRMFSSSNMVKRLELGHSCYDYFCHIDPARTSDYYALAVGHCEIMYGTNGQDGRPLRRVVIDHIHFWNPKTKNQPVSETEVEDYILYLHQKFRFKQVSIDQWNSQSSVIKLKNMRIPIVEKTFNKQYKETIYTELATLLREDRIDIYDMSGGIYTDARGNVLPLEEIKEAKTQFLFLQKKWKGNRFIIESLKGYKDDICDAVAAVAYEAIFSKIAIVFPKSRLINTGTRIR